MKKTLKNILFIRRIWDFYMATKYFNSKYIKILLWSFKSKEDTNFTYELSEKNLMYLACTVASIFKLETKVCLYYIKEINNDIKLKDFIEQEIKKSKFKHITDNKVLFSRRIGWYLFVRLLKPKVVIETGIDKGLGAMVICQALKKNNNEGYHGRYYGTDINPDAGFLFQGELTTFGEILYGDSIETLNQLDVKIDLFINDSDHSENYEYKEYQTIKNKLSPQGFILGDNAHCSDKLALFSIENNRNFLFFKEEPKNHWYPGGGIGISFPKELSTLKISLS